MLGFRVNSVNENSVGEPDQDANSALTELDKGLRSGKVGEQCEAIVRFPRLFEKYPFPILINSSFLKLADVFRMGNNFLRLWVLRVCQQSEKHLDKILNVDEFLRRVFSVLHSNDPVARALALKTLGAVAGIIPERQNVHHAIRRGLDSHDNVEVDAAIYATTRFAAHSNAFAVAVCNKLSEMVECENTGAERRDELVRALRTVHGGAVRAQGVLKLLRSLMERFPSSSTVRAAIAAITNIADQTVVHVPDQVEVLLSIAVNDGRAAVRRSALLGLLTLASHAALWPPACIHSLVLAASHDTRHAMLCLRVMQTLVKCPAVCAAAGSLQRGEEGLLEPSLLRRYCHDAALSARAAQAAPAARVLTDIAVHCYQENLPVEGADLMVALESLVIATGQNDGQDNTKPLRIALGCLVELSNVEPTVYAARTASVLGSQLDSCRWITDATTAQELARLESLLEALGALGGGIYCPRSIQPAMPAIVAKLEQVAQAVKVETMDTDQPESKLDSGTALVLLCTVACQERCGAALSANISGEWEVAVLSALGQADGWCKYRVARAALRYGHHRLAATILKQLAAVAPSEAAQRWLTALHRAAAADHALMQEAVSRLLANSGGPWFHHRLAATILKQLAAVAPSEAAQRWLTALHRAAAADHALMQEGISGLESASAAWELAGDAGGAGGGGCCGGCGGCGACAGMAGAWCSARAAALSALARAAAAARSLCTQPPPATAHANAQASREPSARAGACAGALRRAAKAAQAAANKYATIARAAFYTDNSTLRHLQISQHTYTLVAQFLERITTANYQEKQAIELSFSASELQPRSLEEKAMLAASRKVELLVNKLFDDPTTKPGITHRHAEAVLAVVRACCAGAYWARGACGPRGGGGGARCRLSLSPAPRAPPPDHAAALPLSHHLALKIEGVILPPYTAAGEPNKRLRKKQEERQVKGVQLTVTATPHPRTNEKTVELTNIPPVLTATQTVTPNRDFFSAQQLVSVPAPGLYTVAVEAAFVDQRAVLWQTGPKSSVVIKAHDDPTAKGTTQAARTRF